MRNNPDARIDRSTPESLRDYALLSVALATGRRVSEIAGLRYKHLRKDGNTCIVEIDNCKGRKSFTNRLGAKTTHALYTYLEAIFPGQLLTLPGDAPIWISFSDRNKRQAIGTRTISNICEVYLGTSKTHAPRHTILAGILDRTVNREFAFMTRKLKISGSKEDLLKLQKLL